MKKPTLKVNWNAVEGSIGIPDEWNEYDALVLADLLKDWIGDLTVEYNKAVSELFCKKKKPA